MLMAEADASRAQGFVVTSVIVETGATAATAYNGRLNPAGQQ